MKRILLVAIILFIPITIFGQNTKTYSAPYRETFGTVVALLEEAGYFVLEENESAGRIVTDWQRLSQFLGTTRRRWAIRLKDTGGGTKVTAVPSGGKKLSVAVDFALGAGGQGWDDMSEKTKQKAVKQFFKHLDKKMK